MKLIKEVPGVFFYLGGLIFVSLTHWVLTGGQRRPLLAPREVGATHCEICPSLLLPLPAGGISVPEPNRPGEKNTRL